jgi:hypothetical protein
LLHEWASLQPWDYPPVYELRLGPTPLSAAAGVLTPEIEGMLRVRNRYADLVGVTPSEVQIIEAKMVFDPGAISQVQHYVDLAHNTPLLRNYPGRIIQPVILVAFDDPVLRQKAEAAGIRVILYTPPWAGEWLVKRYGGKQAPTASNSSSE